MLQFIIAFAMQTWAAAAPLIAGQNLWHIIPPDKNVPSNTDGQSTMRRVYYRLISLFSSTEVTCKIKMLHNYFTSHLNMALVIQLANPTPVWHVSQLVSTDWNYRSFEQKWIKWEIIPCEGGCRHCMMVGWWHWHGYFQPLVTMVTFNHSCRINALKN